MEDDLSIPMSLIIQDPRCLAPSPLDSPNPTDRCGFKTN